MTLLNSRRELIRDLNDSELVSGMMGMNSGMQPSPQVNAMMGQMAGLQLGGAPGQSDK